MTSELVKPHHLRRRAVIYIRQSTPHQVLNNQESLRLQYALHGRARALGWHEADIEVIDSDDEATPSYAELAAKYELPTTDVTNYLAWARREFRACVLQQLRETTATEEEFHREARAILGIETK